jgi:hypothetical protein
MALLPIFCVARSSRTDLSMIVGSCLENRQNRRRSLPPIYETMH